MQLHWVLRAPCARGGQSRHWGTPENSTRSPEREAIQQPSSPKPQGVGHMPRPCAMPFDSVPTWLTPSREPGDVEGPLVALPCQLDWSTSYAPPPIIWSSCGHHCPIQTFVARFRRAHAEHHLPVYAPADTQGRVPWPAPDLTAIVLHIARLWTVSTYEGGA